MNDRLQESLASLSAELADVARHLKSELTGRREPKKPDWWERGGAITGWVSLLIIPVVLAVIGYAVNATLQGRESRSKLVELAINILKSEPAEDRSDVAVREWATRVVQKHSDVPFSQSALESLETGPLRTADRIVGGIVGPDDRVDVTDTAQFPWSAVCHLAAKDKDGSRWEGTGVLVSPRVVLTIDFVTRGPDDPVSEIEVAPGRDRERQPFGRMTATRFRFSKSGKDGSPRIAAVILPADARGQPLPYSHDDVAIGSDIVIAGYPADRGGALSTANGKVVARLESVLHHLTDTGAGMSGAPLWRTGDAKHTLIAIHSASGFGSKEAIRITPTVRAEIDEWVREAGGAE